MKLGEYELNQIYTGDARELSKGIPDESVDLILCDPVYWQIDDYRWLAQEGKRVLKPYGYCIAQVGTYYLFEAMKAMSESLDYYWLISETLTYAAAFFARKVAQLHKPYLWFAKGVKNCPERRFMIDRLTPSPKNKAFHQWGDDIGAMIPIIDRLTIKGQIVFDPFCGGGTVEAACKELSRQYIGFEINEETALKAQRRLYEMPEPLPFTYHDSYQGRLFEGMEDAAEQRFAPDLERRAETLVAEN